MPPPRAAGDFRLGLATLGDWLPDPATGQRISEAERFRQFVELGVLAEALGFDTYHVGEHHFSEYVVSSPVPVLAAVAERTSRIRLSTAASLLPHHDPVHLAEDYASLDVLSGGRVEIVAGRGVYHGHYRQFGQRWEDSEALLVEAVELVRRLWTERSVTWCGTLRPPLDAVTIHPRPLQRPHPPIWLSASSLDSVARAVSVGCPIVVPTVSTGVELPPSLAAAYREGWTAAARHPDEAAVALHVHMYVGDATSAAARERWAPHQRSYLRWVLGEVRGPGTPLPPFLDELGTPAAQAVCGDVEDVTEELAARIDGMGGIDHLLIQSDQGGLPFAEACGSIERFVHEVVPRLRARTIESAAGRS